MLGALTRDRGDDQEVVESDGSGHIELDAQVIWWPVRYAPQQPIGLSLTSLAPTAIGDFMKDDQEVVGRRADDFFFASS